ncbi:2-hydroxyacid dehydrogenase [Mesorhizobium sp. L-8-10]|uniref:2-hydroxyacid dehydrogenase n=1 Tax=Mesorhizobium sp. L-8-10 TaxID=2744523 RepID=UPI001927D3CD|nr:2-hydroxyacid dehydrogenase [Mesorhizobium sp. L-8-10]
MIGPYPQWDMEELEARYRLHKLWTTATPDELMAEAARGVRAIATRGELGASAALMDRLPKLEIVSCYGVGTDAIDLGYARDRGIRVTNTPDVLTEDVADIGIGLALAVCRQIPQADLYVRNGSWRGGNMHLVTRFHGKRVGVVGMGRVGAAFARRAAAFDCAVSYFDIAPRADLPYAFVGDLVELARGSDFLIVTLSGGGSTQKIVNAEVLAALGPDGFLVNISRGTTVDETALLEALEAGTVKGAGLDVFWNEPAIDERFHRLSNVVLQPHHASGTIETRKAMGKLVRDNLAAHFGGQPLLTPVV